MNAIVTVVGQDKVGIIAAVCALLAEHNVNILDISQTILQGSFTMVMAVDVGAAKVSVGELRDLLEQLGQKMEHLYPHPAGGDIRCHASHLTSRGSCAHPLDSPYPSETLVTGDAAPGGWVKEFSAGTRPAENDLIFFFCRR